MTNQINNKDFKISEKGIPLKTFEDKTIGEINKLDKDYKRLIKGGRK